MKPSKIILYVSCIGVFTLALAIYSYFSQECDSCGQAKVTKADAANSLVEPNGQITLTSKDKGDKELSKKLFEKGRYLDKTDNEPQERLAKKKYDDDWCIANIELNESDYNFVKTQIDDWDEFQGKARANSTHSSYTNELLYPNSNFISSYEALPPEQLKSLAIGGDKWAMVAFIQSEYTDSPLKDEIAKKLLIQGASYYALEHLVIRAVSAAKTSYRRFGANQNTIDHMIDALNYAYWGLEHYNVGGIGPFIANVSREPLKSNLPLEWLLSNSAKDIKNSYAELANWIQEEREKQGIVVPDAPKAVQKGFSKNMAIRQYLSKNEMDILSTIKITNNDPLRNDPCVDKYLADLKSKLE